MAIIEIKRTFLRHEGGTKFYEVVGLYNHSANRFVLVKRWGKMSAEAGGGELKIEPYGYDSDCLQAGINVVDAKRKRGYDISRSLHGVHNLSDCHRFEADHFNAIVGAHYGDKATVASLAKHLAIDAVYDWRDYEPSEIISEEPMPEPERSGDWGSW